jgi:pSer/pThr/pTyr-binding forkhead associated (FHA) protein
MAPTITLIRIDADAAKRAVTLNKPRTVIGRQTDCELRVPVSEVSRQHCEIVIEDGFASIADLGSSNGTFVNGERVESRRLNPGDVIAVGPLVLVVKIDGEPEEFDVTSKFRLAGSRAASEGVESRSGSSASGLLAAEGLRGDPDDSSVADFDFDFDDDDQDDQPPL